MFKRVERKRKRREEEEEGPDRDTKETLGLVATDSDESDSDSEHDSRSHDSDADIGQHADQEEDAALEDEDSDEEPPISVAEALRDPIYLISLDPTVHGCVLCKGKLIKSAGMSTAHKNANLHKRRFEHFKRLAAQTDSHGNAWELVNTISSVPNVQGEEPGLSKRALKRQVKQAVVREKRKRHKELKAKAIEKKALKRLSVAGEANSAPSTVNSRSSPLPRNLQGKTRKKRKVGGSISTDTTTGTREATTKLASCTKTSSGSKKSLLKSRLKVTGKATKPS